MLKYSHWIFLALFAGMVYPAVAKAMTGQNITDWISAIASVAGVIVAFFALVFLRKTYQQTLEANMILQRQLKSTEARISATKPSVKPEQFDSANSAFNYYIRWVNSGLSMALQVKTDIRIFASTEDIVSSFDVYSKLKEEVGLTIGPSDSIDNTLSLSFDDFQRLASKFKQDGPHSHVLIGESLVLYCACSYRTPTGEYFEEFTFGFEFANNWGRAPGVLKYNLGDVVIKPIGERSGPVDIEALSS
ncbi:hypothetical protein PHACT_12475 [Pseudohongiella acticola]|uniref:SMODS-associating 2TM beta-strand rich effector domain-containing protein n=1 Tax=Pseudohongiella acticola TaxID=1524254 RepID=A0A1E8CG76_9GAMM|nr:hypothetical protein [Pseudohongiella acticola]OFE11366.1 hypothetical protein PHACT_12475 [Pseudohongiella acticola]